MGQIELTIPDDVEIRIQQLVDEGEFTSFEDGVQELLSSGLTVYRTDTRDEEDDFGPNFEDDLGPSEPAGHDDDYVF